MRFWLALAIVAGTAAVSATFWIGRGQKSIPVTDLARLETSVDPSLSPVHAALAWTFEIIGGERVLTDTDRDRKCRYCAGETFQRWGKVRKPVRDNRYRSVGVHRYRCCPAAVPFVTTRRASIGQIRPSGLRKLAALFGC